MMDPAGPERETDDYSGILPESVYMSAPMCYEMRFAVFFATCDQSLNSRMTVCPL